MGGRPAAPPEALLVLRAVESRARGRRRAGSRRPRATRGHAAHVLHEADAADDGRWVDGAAVGLVVERDVPGDDRHAERLAGERHPLDRLAPAPSAISGFSGLPKLRQSVTPIGPPPGAGDVARCFEHGERTAGPRVERAIRPCPSSESASPRKRAAAAGPPHRAPVDGPCASRRAGRSGGRPTRARPATARRAARATRSATGGDRERRGRRATRAGARARPIARAFVREQPGRDRADELVVPERAQLAAVGDLADHGVRQLPALADLLDGSQALRLDHRDHPLLRLGDHHLPRLHPLLAERDPVEPHVDSVVRGHLRQGRGEPGGAAVLQRLDEAALDQLHARPRSASCR